MNVEFTEDEAEVIRESVKQLLSQRTVWIPGTQGYGIIAWNAKEMKKRVSLAVNILTKLGEENLQHYKLLKIFDLSKNEVADYRD